jgi:hypothetical protein
MLLWRKSEPKTHRYASVSTPCQETMNAAGVRWHRRVEATSCSSCGAWPEPSRGERREGSLRREEVPTEARSSSPSARAAGGGGGGQVVATGGRERGGEGIEGERESNDEPRKMTTSKNGGIFFPPSLALARFLSPSSLTQSSPLLRPSRFPLSLSLFSVSLLLWRKTRSKPLFTSLTKPDSLSL